MEKFDDIILNATKRLCKSNQQPNEDKLCKTLVTENEQFTKEKLEEKLIQLTQNQTVQVDEEDF